MARVRSIKLREVTRPLKIPFSTALGSKDVMRSVVVTVTLDDETSGRGEVPTSYAFRGETIPVICRVLKEVSSVTRGADAGDHGPLAEELRRRYPGNPMTVAGLETALFRAHLASTGLTEHRFWGSKARTVTTDITIPLIDAEEKLRAWITQQAARGFSVFKVKTSGDFRRDGRLLDVIWGVLSGLGRETSLRLDGNQGYTVESYRRVADHAVTKGYTVEFFEQPLPKEDVVGMKEIRRWSPFPVILDESVLTAEHLRRAIDEGLCDGVNIKVAKSGISESRRILHLAKRKGLKVMMGCMMETMTGLSAAIYLAAGTGGIDYIDLDAIHFLHHRNHYGDIVVDGPDYILADQEIYPAPGC